MECSDIIEIIGIVVSLVGVFFAAWAAWEAKKAADASLRQARISAKDLQMREEESKQTLKRERYEATIDAYNKLQEQVLDDLNNYTEGQVKQICVDGHKNEGKDEFRKLGTYLARIEHFCVGVNHDVYDIDVLYELAGGYLDWGVWEKMHHVILKKQKGHETKHYYHNYEDVVNKIRKIRAERKDKEQREE